MVLYRKPHVIEIHGNFKSIDIEGVEDKNTSNICTPNPSHISPKYMWVKTQQNPAPVHKDQVPYLYRIRENIHLKTQTYIQLIIYLTEQGTHFKIWQ